MATTRRAPLRMAVSCWPSDKSADNDGGCGKLPAAQGVVLLGDLHGQLARGNEHERGDSGRVLREKLFHHRDQERERLAGSCLRGGENVLALQRLRDGRSLHRGGQREIRRL